MIVPDWVSEDGTVILYNRDCLDVLPTFKIGSVDAVITDPPFGIGFKYASYDDTSEEYGAWLWSIIEQCEQKARPGSPIFIWQAMLNVRKFVEWFPRDWRLFAACKNFVQMRPTAMQYAFDPVVVWWKEGAKAWTEGTASRDFYVANTSPSCHIGLNNVKGHPCPRPLEAVRHIIGQWVIPDGCVLDCFMGSGTTGVACIQLRRKFIGIEIDEKYFHIAVKRITEAQMQLHLPLEGAS